MPSLDDWLPPAPASTADSHTCRVAHLPLSRRQCPAHSQATSAPHALTRTHTALRRSHAHSLPPHTCTRTLTRADTHTGPAARHPAPAHSSVAPPALWARQPGSRCHSSSNQRRQAAASPRRPATALPRSGARISRPGRDGVGIYWNMPCVEKNTPSEKGLGAVKPKKQPQACVRGRPRPGLPSAFGPQQMRTEDLPGPSLPATQAHPLAAAPHFDCNLCF